MYKIKLLLEGYQSRIACIIFHLNCRKYQIIECQSIEFKWLFSGLLVTYGFCVVVLRFFGLYVKNKKKKKKETKRKIKFLSLTSTYRISNHLMQYIPHHIQTIMFTTLKSSAFFISTAVTEQYSCQN